MCKFAFWLLVGINIFILTACSSDFLSAKNKTTGYPSVSSPSAGESTDGLNPVANVKSSGENTGGGNIGGSIVNTMDGNDKVKLSRALDNAPGKSTQWKNSITGNNYTVTPTRKVNINNNPYCRTYQINAIVNNKEQSYSGTACISSQGSWQES